MCYLSKPSNTFHFVTLFLAYEDIVVGFAIFHIELSTPQLVCFIYSSLICKRAGQTIVTSKKRKKEKKALLHGL
jgi:hypothetical protein